MKKENNKKQDKNNESISLISSGEREDNMGVTHNSPKNRHYMQEGENIDEIELDKTLFFMELIAYLCLIIAISSTAGAFLKSSPDQYIQYPNGTIQKIEKTTE